MHLLYDQTPGGFYDIIAKGGVPALLWIILWGGFKKWWVFGWQMTDMEKRLETLRGEKNEWKEIALRSTNLAETLNEVSKLPLDR